MRLRNALLRYLVLRVRVASNGSCPMTIALLAEQRPQPVAEAKFTVVTVTCSEHNGSSARSSALLRLRALRGRRPRPADGRARPGRPPTFGSAALAERSRGGLTVVAEVARRALRGRGGVRGWPACARLK